MLAAGIPSRAGLDRHHNNAVDDGLGDLGRAQRFLIVGLADGVAAVGDDHHDLSSLPAFERLRAEINSVVKGGGGSHRQAVDTAVDRPQVGGESHRLIYYLVESVDGEPVDRAQNGVREAAGGVEFKRQVLACAQAGINLEHDRKRQLGLLVKDGNFLRLAVFEKLEIFFGEITNRPAVLVGYGHKNIHQLYVNTDGCVVLAFGGRSRGSWRPASRGPGRLRHAV